MRNRTTVIEDLYPGQPVSKLTSINGRFQVVITHLQYPEHFVRGTRLPEQWETIASVYDNRRNHVVSTASAFQSPNDTPVKKIGYRKAALRAMRMHNHIHYQEHQPYPLNDWEMANQFPDTLIMRLDTELKRLMKKYLPKTEEERKEIANRHRSIKLVK